MVPKCVPGKFGDQSVILMCVLAVVSKDEVRGRQFLQVFEQLLDGGSLKRHEAIAEILQHHAVPLDAGKQFRAALRFSFANSVSTEYYPLKYTARVLFPEPENCATATNFDVVRVAAQAQNL